MLSVRYERSAAKTFHPRQDLKDPENPSTSQWQKLPFSPKAIADTLASPLPLRTILNIIGLYCATFFCSKTPCRLT